MARLSIVKPNDIKSHSKYLYHYKIKKYALYISLLVNALLAVKVFHGR